MASNGFWILGKRVALVMALSMVSAAPAAWAHGQGGTTIGASKTLDICAARDGRWRYEGIIAVWNKGKEDTEGLAIVDTIQSKTKGKGDDDKEWIDRHAVPIALTTPVIPVETKKKSPTVFTYSHAAAPVPGVVRNVARVTITNHSGHAGQAFGKDAKSKYDGPLPPPACPEQLGCTRTPAQWVAPALAWPAPLDRDAPFLVFSEVWQSVLENQGPNPWYETAKQYAAAALNVANGALMPPSVETAFSGAEAALIQFSGKVFCSGNTCSDFSYITEVLATFNRGEYPGAPQPCQ